MKTKLLPIAVAILSVASASAQAADNDGAKTDAYVTDSYGNIVRDFWGSCTRSTAWTPETAIASCEKDAETAVDTDNNNSEPATETQATAPPVNNDDIQNNEKRGYVIDSDGYVVRDSWGACVRTIEWTVENEIARCEGKEEAQPEPVVVAPVVTPPPAPVIKPAPVVVAPKPIPTIAQFRGFFDTESAVLKSSAHAELDAYADFLTAHPNSKITISGHTDSRGEANYNQQLSERRAKAAKTYLMHKGIASNRMEAHGDGETQPIADNKTSEGRAQNRRVEVELIK